MKKLLHKFAFWLAKKSSDNRRDSDFLKELFEDIDTGRDVSMLSDRAVAELLLKRIWSRLPGPSYESAITESAIDRLRRAQGGPIDQFYGMPEEERRR
jgi:hypothetical protein